MSATVDVGAFIILYVVENGGQYHVSASEWDVLDAAHGNWIERRIDKQLCLTGVGGAEIRIAASRLSDMNLSTAESRQRQREFDAGLKAEDPLAE